MKNNLNWRDNWQLKLQAQNINVHNSDHVVMETRPLQWPFFNFQLSEYQIIFKKPLTLLFLSYTGTKM